MVHLHSNHRRAKKSAASMVWHGRLSQLGQREYLCKRGQVLPYYFNGRENIFYSGIDIRFNEIAGFGGRVERGESAIVTAFRELDEESARLISPSKRGVDYECIIYKDTLFIPVPTDARPTIVDEYVQLLKTGKPSGTLVNVVNNGYTMALENSSLVATGEKEMNRLADLKISDSGVKVWPFYAELLWHVRDKLGPFSDIGWSQAG